jgi:catechol 2,3-dioxygenase-like lactoylglutathione lyase family enzyme
MADQMRDFRDSKGMARTLREALAERGLAIGHGESLELIARLFALPNWNVLAARIGRAGREHLLTPAPETLEPDQPATPAISPFFIVADVTRSLAFYREKLGFSVAYKEPEEDAFFAIIYRDGAQIFLKSERDVEPVPNRARHPHLRWDAFVYAPDPDGLHACFAERGAAFSEALRDTHDGLRGFEVTDPDGYVLFFGRPQ